MYLKKISIYAYISKFSNTDCVFEQYCGYHSHKYSTLICPYRQVSNSIQSKEFKFFLVSLCVPQHQLIFEFTNPMVFSWSPLTLCHQLLFTHNPQVEDNCPLRLPTTIKEALLIIYGSMKV